MFSLYKEQSGPFVIAEVGQNHQGSFELALDYVRIFADSGANAIKFQMRSNKNLFAKDAYERVYESENAFGKTYGEHREYLELDFNEMCGLRDECLKRGVKFIVTPFDEESLESVVALDVDAIKVSSFDLANLPFLDKIASKMRPIIISVGGGRIIHINSSIQTIKQHHSDLAILHCVSEYPCDVNRIGLNNIRRLKELFPNDTVGLSDHFNGILTGPLGYIYGARVFEKHVTLNRAWKGTDHSFALEPQGFKNFVRDIYRTPAMHEPKNNDEIGTEPVFAKLGKSITASRDLATGTVLDLDSLSGKIFNQVGIPVRESHRLLGKRLLRPVSAGEKLNIGDFNE
jgi:sialic acid synthase